MKKIFTLLICCGLILSCSDEDSESNQPNNPDNNPNPTVVNFSMTRYVPSAMNEEFEAFEMGEIVWKFDFIDQEIQVTVSDEVQAVFLDTGTYSYTLEDNVCNYGDNRYIHPDGRLMGLMIMDEYDDGVITISDGCVDGPIFTFERN